MASTGRWEQAHSHGQPHHRGLSLEKPGEGDRRLAGGVGKEVGDEEGWARLTSVFSSEKSGARDQPLKATLGVGDRGSGTRHTEPPRDQPKLGARVWKGHC